MSNNSKSGSLQMQGNGNAMPSMAQILSERIAREQAQAHAKRVAEQTKDKSREIAQQAAARQFHEIDDAIFYPHKK
ncbi:hypothetical protein KJ359_011701 [Pestalotiopsis sp. 9143b]|nr:hypothetical protein KJ359_011701 [Pestalotiopsis sp. 9143b]